MGIWNITNPNYVTTSYISYKECIDVRNSISYPVHDTLSNFLGRYIIYTADF
jgi:hypothetical protein